MKGSEKLLSIFFLIWVLTMGKKEEAKRPKCIECKTRDATKDDNLCDSCRYSKLLGNMIKDRDKK